MKLTFIELPLFTVLFARIADDHHLNRLQNDLLKNPEKAFSFLACKGCGKRACLSPAAENRAALA